MLLEHTKKNRFYLNTAWKTGPYLVRQSCMSLLLDRLLPIAHVHLYAL